MQTKLITIAIFLLTLVRESSCQIYPSFGSEIPVKINGLTFDAMEPSVSPGDFLFNSLNDGLTTSIYYASKLNDSIFGVRPKTLFSLLRQKR